MAPDYESLSWVTLAGFDTSRDGGERRLLARAVLLDDKKFGM